MRNPEINLRAISEEQALTVRACENRQSDPADEQNTAWTEEYAASGAVKNGNDQCG